MLSFLIWALALLVAVTVHESAHAWVSDKLGDPTARLLGRISLNPLAHLDPIGTLMLVFFRFGWGKPVPFDPFNLRNPKKDSALISLAGPTSNLILATLLSLLLRFTPLIAISFILIPIIIININLAIFNLLPIPPLDGSKILYGILPMNWAEEYNSFMKDYGTILLILLIIPISGTSMAINNIMPVINLVTNFLLPF